MNDLNKCRDEESAKGFAGYSLFQNLIVGGQNKYGEDVTNDLSFHVYRGIQAGIPAAAVICRSVYGTVHRMNC